MQRTKFESAFRRLKQQDKGNVTVIVAFATTVIAGLWAGALDYSQVISARSDLQDSLDAATLAVARSEATEDDDYQAIGEDALDANLRPKGGAVLAESRFFGANEGRLIKAEAEMTVPASILGRVGDGKVRLTAKSEVVRSSKDIEVALVLDTTGSMAGQKIVDLRSAANELVEIVVKDQQTPFYTKVAVVPYSMGVNVGSYATEARGAVAPAVAITGATKANPVRITAANHGFTNGARVYITGVQGMTQINNKTFVVANATTNTFTLSGVDGREYSSYNRGGSIHCTTGGCEYYSFMNNDSPSVRKTFRISNCVTERTGVNAYTDVAPSVERLGRNYASPNNPCLSNVMQPLTSNKATLKTNIDALQAAGSTAGHIGIGWGWYTLSPNFSALWPAGSDPAAYRTANLIKAAVIMTDGEYNSSYCNGVIAKSSTTGSGSKSDHINCDAPNGHAFAQAKALCEEMKDTGVIVYTVGFDVVDDERARELVSACATDSDHVYLPSTGSDLKLAFRAIAQDLSRLRLSH